MNEHSFCRAMATSVCRSAKIRKTYLYVEPKNENDSHYTVQFDGEGDGRRECVQGCCKQAAIFEAVSNYLEDKEKDVS